MTTEEPSGIHLARLGQMVMPNEEAEERIVVPVPDFEAIKENVLTMRHPVASANSWMTAFLGIAVGAAVTWGAMPHHTTASNTVAIVVAAALVLAVFMFWVRRDQAARDRSDKDRILKHMQRLEETCPRIRPDSTGS